MITFRDGVGSVRKATVKCGEESFDIEYETPGAADVLEADIRTARHGAGLSALWLCSRVLRSWSLPEPLGATHSERERVLASLSPSEALLAIYLEVKESGLGELKN